ncbi:hypothetical protein Y032_0075g974 [Ancylostoma ceylanicum]|uniref:protein-L-isoaspartate(D-aspartate) O-methyltransferase n=2 Tax=Ancylostoma ceylanicum TaxID=53326 RepID=A0A016TUY4_9BILA|nr:hypothetical protein Y032_0075g974 [Ancylostoma ceylanicum]
MSTIRDDEYVALRKLPGKNPESRMDVYKSERRWQHQSFIMLGRLQLQTGSTGKVVGIEHIPQLVELAKENTMKHHADLIDSGRILFVEGDGRKGYPMEQKYDAIHVGAAAETVPQPLIDQLAEGGRMLIPVGKESGNQVFLQVDKQDGNVTQKVIEHVIYVPLTSKAHQLGRYDL